MDYKKKNKHYYKKNNYYYSNKNNKPYNYNYSQNNSNIYNDKDQEIERLLNIIETLKSKNSMLIEENKYLKLQIKELKSEKKYSNNNNNFYPKGKNYIYAEYIISDEDVNKDIRILNHDEEREIDNFDDSYGPSYYKEGTDNKDEIEESCTIYFGKKPIKFSETFNFYKPGKYSFIFEFKYKLSNINRLFKDCDSLFSADLSHFDSSNLKEIDSLFENCSNLKYIDFSNIYSSSLKKTNNAFYGVHDKCRLISKDKSLNDKFDSDKNSYKHKDDYYYDDYD